MRSGTIETATSMKGEKTLRELYELQHHTMVAHMGSENVIGRVIADDRFIGRNANDLHARGRVRHRRHQPLS